MIDAFDYKEPSCAVCGGESFYYPDSSAPLGTVPIRHVTDKLDSVLARNDMAEGERLLEYWLGEARALRDKRGELAVLSEMMGLYRKTSNKEKGLKSVYDGLELVRSLKLDSTVSGATIILNAATTLKAFGKADEALPLYEEVSVIYDKELAPYDVKRAGLFNNAALAYADVGRYDEAEKRYLSALDVLSHSEKNDNEIAVTYVNLAHLYEKEGRDEDIYPCIEKAIEYLDSPRIERNGYHAFVCTKCAPSIGYFGFFLAQEKFEQRAKELYART